MALKVDLIVAGHGIGVHAAALCAAKTGLSVAWLPSTKAPVVPDPIGLLLSSAAEQVARDFATHAPGLSKVVAHRVFLLGDQAGTTIDYRSNTRLAHPEAFTYDRAKYENWLSGVAEMAGTKRLEPARIAEIMAGDNGQTQAIRTTDGTIVRCRAVVIGRGAEHPIQSILDAAKQPEERIRATAVGRIPVAADKLADRLGLEPGEGLYGRVIGNLASGVPGTGWMLTSGDSLQVGLDLVVGPFAEDPEGLAKSQLTAFLANPALKPTVRGLPAPSVQTELSPISGYKYIAPVYGNGWMLVGPAARLSDPLRHESSHFDLLCGKFAADAACRAIKANDTSSRSLSVYRAMLDDSFLMQDLKSQKNAVEEIERDPTVLSYYSSFVNRWLENDTGSALAPRRERNREFMRNLRNERPVWEFAMGLRKSLRLMRD
jgi:electron transfer flavoprotein-quinone oxidoreductase